VDGAFRAVAAAGQWLVDQVSAALAWFGTLPGLVAGWMEGARNGFVNGWNAVVNWVRGVPGMIVGALGDLGNLLLGAGRAIIDGFLRGLRAAWGAVTDFVGGIASWIANNKGPLSYDRRLLIPAGRAIMAGLYKGLDDNFGRVRSLVAGMAADIASPFSEPIDVQMSAGFERQIQSLPRGMSADVMHQVSPDDFGSSIDDMAEAMGRAIDGRKLTVDGAGVAKLVNKTNIKNARRG
jgi:hypothetical protein